MKLAVFGVLFLWFGAASVSAGRFDAFPNPEKWIEGFRLEPGVTYTYELIARDGHGRGRQHDELRGELNLWRVPGERDEIRFWYSVDGVNGSGSAPNDPRALAGALLLSAFARPEPLELDALRLLSTPLQWVHWIDRFLESDFRRGVVWEVYQHPPVRFSAEREGGGRYSGDVRVGRDVVLELEFRLSRPLPLEIVSHHGRDVYTAVLVDPPGRGPLR